MFVGDSLDQGNSETAYSIFIPFAHHKLDLRNILDREELPDTYISGAHSSPGNGSTEGIPTSHQDSESQQLNEKAV